MPFTTPNPQLIKLGETALIPIYSPYHSSTNKVIATCSIPGELARKLENCFC